MRIIGVLLAIAATWCARYAIDVYNGTLQVPKEVAGIIFGSFVALLAIAGITMVVLDRQPTNYKE